MYESLIIIINHYYIYYIQILEVLAAALNSFLSNGCTEAPWSMLRGSISMMPCSSGCLRGSWSLIDWLLLWLILHRWSVQTELIVNLTSSASTASRILIIVNVEGKTSRCCWKLPASLCCKHRWTKDLPLLQPGFPCSLLMTLQM